MKRKKQSKKTKQVQIPEDLKNLPTRCYAQGRRKILSLEEAYILFWKVNFAWHMLLDWFRSSIDGDEKEDYMMRVAKPSGARFAYQSLTRGSMALSTNDACLLDEYGCLPSKDVVTQDASKFGKCFCGKKLFESTYVCDRGRKQLAYRVRQGMTWLIVLGLDTESDLTKGLTDDVIEWEIFKTPPAKGSNNE